MVVGLLQNPKQKDLRIDPPQCPKQNSENLGAVINCGSSNRFQRNRLQITQSIVREIEAQSKTPKDKTHMP